MLDVNESVFSLDCNSLMKRMCLINNFIPCKVIHRVSGLMGVGGLMNPKLDMNWKSAEFFIEDNLDIRIEKKCKFSTWILGTYALLGKCP